MRGGMNGRADHGFCRGRAKARWDSEHPTPKASKTFFLRPGLSRSSAGADEGGNEEEDGGEKGEIARKRAEEDEENGRGGCGVEQISNEAGDWSRSITVDLRLGVTLDGSGRLFPFGMMRRALGLDAEVNVNRLATAPTSTSNHPTLAQHPSPTLVTADEASESARKLAVEIACLGQAQKQSRHLASLSVHYHHHPRLRPLHDSY
ncbi:hypothetical protein QCA50_014265 [Cerrena zonata]|uniref:Uncharacterized protein n=1 Tax=Cerrena zonata TaxID=2478898 RepID=A0AAW0G0E6_9APHY